MKRTLLLSSLLIWMSGMAFCQEIDVPSVLKQIQANIDSENYSAAIDVVNNLKIYLNEKMSVGASSDVIEADTLFSAYVGNEQKAIKLYRGKTLQVHGVISKIGSSYDSSLNKVPSVTMSMDSFGFRTLDFQFSEEDADALADLSINDEIIIQGVVGDFSSGLTLEITECRIISTKYPSPAESGTTEWWNAPASTDQP